MKEMDLKGLNVLITGAGVRVGRGMALAVAEEGCNVVIHYYRSEEEAEVTKMLVEARGVEAYLLQANLADPEEAAGVIEETLQFGDLFAVINSASMFVNQDLFETDQLSWDKHFAVNLRAPFLMSQAFGKYALDNPDRRIVNILDWRAFRPGADHFAYTISKAGLAAMTRSLAIALAPNITVNGIAFGAILPPSDGADTQSILENVPAKRWASMDEVGETLLFLLKGPSYITGEVIHLDGGRQLI